MNTKNSYFFVVVFVGMISAKDISPRENARIIPLNITKNTYEYYLMNPADTLSFFVPSAGEWKFSSRSLMVAGNLGEQVFSIDMRTSDTSIVRSFRKSRAEKVVSSHFPHHWFSYSGLISQRCDEPDILLVILPKTSEAPIVVRMRFKSEKLNYQEMKFKSILPTMIAQKIFLVVNEKKKRYEYILPGEHVTYVMTSIGMTRFYFRALFSKNSMQENFTVAVKTEDHIKETIYSVQIDSMSTIMQNEIGYEEYFVSKSKKRYIEIFAVDQEITIYNRNPEPIAIRGRFAEK